MKTPRSRGSQIYLLHLLAVAVGLVLVVLGPWRAGARGRRRVVPGRGRRARRSCRIDHTGMLRVRGKVFDVVWMTLAGRRAGRAAVIVPS